MSFFLGNKIDVKANIINSIPCNFSSFMALIKHGFLSEIVCTVNFKSSLNLVHLAKNYMSRVVRIPAFCICDNKDADQLRGNREADQRLCFRYIDSTIPLLSKYEILSL